MKNIMAGVALLLLSACDSKLMPIQSVNSAWRVEGVVSEKESQKPIAGAVLRLERMEQWFLWSEPSTVLVAQTSSAADGSFSFAGQLSGEFFIRARHQGHDICGPIYPVSIHASTVIHHSIRMTNKVCPLIM